MLALTAVLALVVVALAAAIATPAAKGATAPTWSYQQGMGGSAPFSFVALDPLLLTIGADQSLAFQVTAAALAAPSVQNDNQITVWAKTSQLDLPMSAGPDTLKDFLTLGGDLETFFKDKLASVPGVTVSTKPERNVRKLSSFGTPRMSRPVVATTTFSA